MIIVSQDKRKIINFDNIAHIFIQNDDKSIGYGRMSGYGANELGTYKTEERTKEVLQEIYKVYSDFTLIKCVNEKYQNQLIIGNINKYFDIYEMPED